MVKAKIISFLLYVRFIITALIFIAFFILGFFSIFFPNVSTVWWGGNPEAKNDFIYPGEDFTLDSHRSINPYYLTAIPLELDGKQVEWCDSIYSKFSGETKIQVRNDERLYGKTISLKVKIVDGDETTAGEPIPVIEPYIYEADPLEATEDSIPLTDEKAENDLIEQLDFKVVPNDNIWTLFISHVYSGFSVAKIVFWGLIIAAFIIVTSILGVWDG